MSHFKRGGIRFIRLGRVRLTFCLARRAVGAVQATARMLRPMPLNSILDVDMDGYWAERRTDETSNWRARR